MRSSRFSTSRPRAARDSSVASGLLVSATRTSFQPTAVARLVAGVQDPARKVLEKHPGPDVVFDPLRDDLERDFPECLVRVRDGLDHHVHRRGGAARGQEQDRPEQPIGADAAGEERDGFPVGGQPAEADQQPGQERHRDRQAERLRDQGAA